MLFNSALFIFAFLPITLAAYFALGRFAGARAACGALVAASLVYYGWWNPRFLLLLVPATLANAALGYALSRTDFGAAQRRLLLWAGIGGNLALLGYFKYAGFFVENINAAFGTQIGVGSIVLPLGISFFTFQKIAFLVDAYHGRVRNLNLLHFTLFVWFFPQLIAGPIVHHGEVMPQFRRPEVGRFNALNFAVGLSVFAIGLFKKTVIADGCATLADPVFDGFLAGKGFSSAETWVGAIAYAFQLYFDFSGYSDMAVGLARMFNIDLPMNFNSPYKAVDIIDFWRRWHITLSRFLRDYLYIPLGGNRKGLPRRYANLLTTMLLGGLWHGASWAFVLWGGMHGTMLIVNHAWQALRHKAGLPAGHGRAGRIASRAVTFVAVVTAWVPFRAGDLGSAAHMVRTMYDPQLAPSLLQFAGGQLRDAVRLVRMMLATLRMPTGDRVYLVEDLHLSGVALLLVAIIVFAAPNVYQVFSQFKVGLSGNDVDRSPWYWTLSARWAFALSLILATALMQLGGITPFLYYQF